MMASLFSYLVVIFFLVDTTPGITLFLLAIASFAPSPPFFSSPWLASRLPRMRSRARLPSRQWQPASGVRAESDSRPRHLRRLQLGHALLRERLLGLLPRLPLPLVFEGAEVGVVEQR